MMITPQSLPSKMKSLPLSAALLLLTAIGVGSASASTISYVGADITQTQYYGNPGYSANISPATWGQTTTQTFLPGDPQYPAGATVTVGPVMTDFRSTDTIAKAYVLPGNQNVYGDAGYAFYGMSTTAGVGLGDLVAKPTFVSNISTIATPITGSFGYVDNPTLTAGAYASSNTIDYGVVRTTGSAPGSTDAVLTFSLSLNQTFRVGIMTGDGNGAKPLSLTLSSSGGGTANAIAIGVTSGSSYLMPDWYFFDVTGLAGETFTFSLQNQGASGGSIQTSFSGIVFDVAAIPEPSTTALLGLGIAACLQMARSRRRSAI